MGRIFKDLIGFYGMMDIKNAIRLMSQTDDEVYSVVGTVQKVDKSRRVCVVVPDNGDAVLYGVRLQSEAGNTEGVVLFPKVGSSVVVTFLNKTTGYIALFSKVEIVEFKAGQLKMTADTEGVHLENKGGDLRKIVDAIVANSEKTFDFLIKLKVITPTGTGVLSPEIIAQVTAEKLKLETLKQQIGQLLK